MRGSNLFFTALLLIVLVTGCNRGDLGDYTKLGGLRVLSLQIDKPEVAPGTAVTITPLLSDIDGGGRALTYSVDACADPGIALGATVTCDERPDKVALVTSAPVSGLASPLYTASAPAFSVTVPATLLEGRSPVVRNNGVSYLVFYRLTPPDGKVVSSFKRIIVSDRAQKNNNPSLDALVSEGNPITALPSSVVKLSVKLPSGVKETYTELASDGTPTTREEEPLTTWFVSDGELSDDRTTGEGTTDWTPPSAKPASRPVLIVGVVRDRRGGEGFLISSF